MSEGRDCADERGYHVHRDVGLLAFVRRGPAKVHAVCDGVTSIAYCTHPAAAERIAELLNTHGILEIPDTPAALTQDGTTGTDNVQGGT